MNDTYSSCVLGCLTLATGVTCNPIILPLGLKTLDDADPDTQKMYQDAGWPFVRLVYTECCNDYLTISPSRVIVSLPALIASSFLIKLGH